MSATADSFYWYGTISSASICAGTIKAKAAITNVLKVTPNADSITAPQVIGDAFQDFFEITDVDCASQASCSIRVEGCSDAMTYTGNLELVSGAG